MVIFYTLAYNAEKTLPRTIQSVLDQTETDWIWYLLDNGAQDGTAEIIRANAAKDPRIIPIRNEKNYVFSAETSFFELPKRYPDSDWFCMLDADDTYTPDFLTEMLTFLERHQLDVAACGFDFVDAETGICSSQRILPQDLILTSQKDFDAYFPIYHQFLRTNWAKLFSVRLTKQLSYERVPDLCYGRDTLYTQELLRHAGRFGILSRSLHRYYISPKSFSYRWDPGRMEADLVLHDLACKFLIDKCGCVSPQNRTFLQAVYSNAVTDTVNVIQNAALSPAEKLREYRGIAEAPVTLAAYRECTDESAARSRARLILRVLEAGGNLGEQDDIDLRTAMQRLLPRCGQSVNAANARMFLEDPALLRALLQDDADAMMEELLERIRDGRKAKSYDIVGTLRALAVEKPLLCQIDDAVFLRRHAGIYCKVWRGDYLAALDEMTGLLLGNRTGSRREVFLTLFIALAALEEHVPAFIFGKVQLACLYLRQGHREEARAIAAELTEMGVEDRELEELRRNLEL